MTKETVTIGPYCGRCNSQGRYRNPVRYASYPDAAGNKTGGWVHSNPDPETIQDHRATPIWGRTVANV